MITFFYQKKLEKIFKSRNILAKRLSSFVLIALISVPFSSVNVASAAAVDLPGDPFLMAGTASCTAGANKINLSYVQDNGGDVTDYYLSRSPFSATDSGWGEISHVTGFSDLPTVDTAFAAGTSFSYQLAAKGPAGTKWSPIITTNTLPVRTREMTQFITVPASWMNWTTNSTINYFDPAWGNLTSVKISRTNVFEKTFKAENLGGGTKSGFSSIFATSTLTVLGRVSTTTYNKTQNAVLLTYDGINDYAGTSGVTIGPEYTTVSDVDMIFSDPAEVNLFVSSQSGGVGISEKIISSSSSGGSANVMLSNTNKASSSIAVTYAYTNTICNNPAASLISAPAMIVRGTPSNPQVAQNLKTTQNVNFPSLSNTLLKKNINYFNPSYGTLTSVVISPKNVYSTSIKAESLVSAPSTVSAYIDATSTMTILSNMFEVPFHIDIGPYTVGPFDGIVDYAGTSGGVFGKKDTVIQTPGVVIVDPVQLSSFVGVAPGGIEVTGIDKVTGFASASQANTSYGSIYNAAGDITATYNYTNAESNINWKAINNSSDPSNNVSQCKTPGLTGATAIPDFPATGVKNIDGGSLVKPTSTTVYGVTCYSGNGDYISETVIVAVIDETSKPVLSASTPSCGVGAGKIALSYTKPSGGPVTDYYLKRSPYSVPDSDPTSGWGDLLHVNSLDELPVLDSGLTPGVSYQYQLQASGPGGEQWSDVTSSLTKATSNCAPVAVSCSASPTTIDVADSPATAVTWTAVPTGGSGAYTYQWTGDYPLNTYTATSATLTYSSAIGGKKYGFVKVTDNSNPPLSIGPVACGDVSANNANANFNLLISSTNASLKFLKAGAESLPVRVTVTPEAGFKGSVTLTIPKTVTVGGVVMDVLLYWHATKTVVTSPVTLSGSQLSDGLDLVLSAKNPIPAGTYQSVLTVTGVSGSKSDSQSIGIDANIVKPVFEEF